MQTLVFNTTTKVAKLYEGEAENSTITPCPGVKHQYVYYKVKMKKIYFILLCSLLLSCQRSFTPQQAANRTGLKCGKHTLR